MEEEKYTQNEIDKLIAQENTKRACTHSRRVTMKYGIGHVLVHCKDCGHMHVEAESKK